MPEAHAVALAALVATASLLSACDSVQDRQLESTALRVQRDSSTRFEVVTVSGQMPALDLRPIHMLGASELNESGDVGPERLSWVSSAAIDRLGRLLVSDLYRQEILVFDPESGSFLRSLGRGGSGPGEFESLFSVAPFGDDALAMDVGNGRTMQLREDGTWVEQWRAAGSLVASPVDFRLYPVGPDEVYQWAYSLDDGLETPVWRRYRWGFEPDEIPRITPVPEQDFPEQVLCQMGRGFSWFPHPFAPTGLSHPLPGRRSVVASTNAFEFAVLGAAGDTLRVVRRPIDPIPTSEESWGPLEMEFEEWLTDKDRSQCEPEDLPRPETLPAITGLMVDMQGRVWVERRLVQGTSWEIFEADGTPVGSVPGFDHDRDRTVPFLGEDYVVWMTRSELDLPRVHVATWAR